MELKDIIVEIFKDSDNEAILANEKRFFPFISIDELLSKYSALLPFLPQTTNVVKTFAISFSANAQ